MSTALLASVSLSVAETPGTEGHQRPNPKEVPLMAAAVLNSSGEPASPLADILTVAPSQHMALYDDGTWAARVELLLKMKDGSLLSPSERSMPVEVKDAEGKTLTCIAKFSGKEDGSVAVSLLLPQKPQGGRITWEASLPFLCARGKVTSATQRIEETDRGSWKTWAAGGTSLMYARRKQENGKSYVVFKYDTQAPVAFIRLFDSRGRELLWNRMTPIEGGRKRIMFVGDTPADGIVQATVTHWKDCATINVPVNVTIGLECCGETEKASVSTAGK